MIYVCCLTCQKCIWAPGGQDGAGALGTGHGSLLSRTLYLAVHLEIQEQSQFEGSHGIGFNTVMVRGNHHASATRTASLGRDPGCTTTGIRQAVTVLVLVTCSTYLLPCLV